MDAPWKLRLNTPPQIQYKLSTAAHLRKPLAVSSVVFGLFVLAGALRRFDARIKA